MLAIGGQIARTFLESTDTPSSKLERASAPAFFLSHQLQATSNDLRLRPPCRGLQLLEGRPVFFAQPGVDIDLHMLNVAQT